MFAEPIAVTVKVYAVGQAQASPEVAAMKHINFVIESTLSRRHTGVENIRIFIETFEIPRNGGPGVNMCLVYQPLGLPLGELRRLVFDDRLPIDRVQIYQALYTASA